MLFIIIDCFRNIYLTKNDHVIVGDLGVIETINDLYSKEGKRSAYDISSAYMSPEMHFYLRNQRVKVTAKTDIWKTFHKTNCILNHSITTHLKIKRKVQQEL